MSGADWPGHAVVVRVGAPEPAALRQALAGAGVRTNEYGDRLLHDERLWSPCPQDVQVVVRSVADLGHRQGAGLFDVFAAARAAGLALCPPDTGVHLRLALMDQPDAPDAVLSGGRAPAGAITVASPPLDASHDLPKGLYLRRVDGVAWLRGYCCDDLYQQPPYARFAFRVPG